MTEPRDNAIPMFAHAVTAETMESRGRSKHNNHGSGMEAPIPLMIRDPMPHNNVEYRIEWTKIELRGTINGDDRKS